MSDPFKISLALLKEGPLPLQENFSSDFLEVNEEELQFDQNVQIQGSASLIDNQILVEINALCRARIPCSICNEWVWVPISLPHIRIVEEVDENKNSFFDYREPLREALLLEVPQFAECQGSCPERKNMESYCKKNQEKKLSNYFPFEKLQ